MNVLLFLMAAGCWAAGVAVFSVARGAPHGIEALILILCGFVCFVGFAIVSRLDDLNDEARKPKPPPVTDPPK